MEEEIEETLVSYETAKLAKDKGFNLNTPKAYNDNGVLVIQSNYPNYIDELDISAPTQALLQKWLREVHNIDFIIKLYYDDLNGKTYTADAVSPPLGFVKVARQKSYEDALEIGLYQALLLL